MFYLFQNSRHQKDSLDKPHCSATIAVLAENGKVKINENGQITLRTPENPKHNHDSDTTEWDSAMVEVEETLFGLFLKIEK